MLLSKFKAKKITNNSVDAYLIWFFCTVFFLYQYIVRIIPGMIESELRQDFLMDATQFSKLGSYFLLVYAFCQIPMGFILDKIGIKKICIFSMAFCVIGNLIITNCSSILLLQFSRILMGIGSSSAYIACIKASNDYLKEKNRGLFMGAALTIGLMGPLIFTAPLLKLIDIDGWQNALNILSYIGILIVIAIVFIMPLDKSDTSSKEIFSYSSIKSSVMYILKSPIIFAYAILTTVFYAPFGTITDIWGIPFLIKHLNINKDDATLLINNIYLSAAISALIVPWICSRFKKINFGIFISWILMVLSLFFLIFAKQSEFFAKLTIIVVGIASSSEMLCFAGAAQYTKNHSSSGTIMGTINTISVLGSALLVDLVGKLLDLNWNGLISNSGVRIYCAQDYKFAITSIFIFVIVLGLIAFLFFIKNKKDRSLI